MTWIMIRTAYNLPTCRYCERSYLCCTDRQDNDPTIPVCSSTLQSIWLRQYIPSTYYFSKDQYQKPIITRLRGNDKNATFKTDPPRSEKCHACWLHTGSRRDVRENHAANRGSMILYCDHPEPAYTYTRPHSSSSSPPRSYIASVTSQSGHHIPNVAKQTFKDFLKHDSGTSVPMYCTS